MAMQRERRGTLSAVALGGIVAALALLNGYLATTSVDVSPLPPAPGPANDDRPANLDLATPLDGKALAQFAETVGRPVFSPNRKPVQRPRAPDNQDSPTDTGEMRLVGIIKIGDRPKRALIRIANEPTGKWVAEGEDFNGWKLRKVSERGVVLEAGGRTHELTLQVARRESGEPDAGEPGRKSR